MRGKQIRPRLRWASPVPIAPPPPLAPPPPHPTLPRGSPPLPAPNPSTPPPWDVNCVHLAEAVSSAALRHYRSLPKKGMSQRHESTVLAAFLLSSEQDPLGPSSCPWPLAASAPHALAPVGTSSHTEELTNGVKWEDIKEHLLHLGKSYRSKFGEFQKALEEKKAEACRLTAEKEANVSAKESASQN